MAYNETYRTDPVAGFAGMVSDQSLAVIASFTAEAAVPFGAAVARGAGTKSCRVVEAGDTAILGIAVRSQAVAAESPNEYPVNDTVSVLRKGPMWITAGGTVAEGDPVGVVVATGLFVTGSGVTIAGATYETAGVANDLVRIHIL